MIEALVVQLVILGLVYGKSDASLTENQVKTRVYHCLEAGGVDRMSRSKVVCKSGVMYRFYK